MDAIKVSAEQFAVSYDDFAGDHEMRDMTLIRTSENQIDRLDRHDRVAIEPIEVEHKKVGGFAGFDFAAARRAIRPSSIGDDRSEIRRTLDHLVEAPAAMQEMAEPHFAQSVVILVQRGTVDAASDAHAFLDRFADRRDP